MVGGEATRLLLLGRTADNVAEWNCKMTWGRVLNFTDPSHYTAAVRAADMQLFPTTAGDFRAEITQAVMNELWMQRFSENLPRVHTGAVRRGRKVFTFLTEDQPEVYNRGRVTTLGEICADDFEVQHVRTSGHYRLGSASLEPEVFAAACKTIVGCEIDSGRDNQFIRPNPDLTNRFLQLHEMVGSIAKTTPELLEFPNVVRALEQQLVHALVRCATDGTPSLMRGGRLSLKGIVAKLEEFLEANPKTPLYLVDVCTAIGTGERTLRAACEVHVGMGPNRYLTLRRMHLAHRALMRADPSKATVTHIATDHGFWELGRFSVGYRTLFGEPPSATLHRPADDRLLHLDRPLSLKRLS
jgi:AraC-like DNA-binding protein